MPIKIIPTIFTRSLLELKERLEQYEEIVDRVQLDAVDEAFSLQPTLRVDKMISVPTSLVKDVHLMTVEPADWLEACAKEGVTTVIGQIEHMSSQREFFSEAKTLGLGVGLAVDLETGFEDLDWKIAKQVDQILIMTVRAGREGQKLNQEGLRRVKEIRKRGFKGDICVDGGVNESTIKMCVKAGANLLAVGSGLWQAMNLPESYKKLTDIINS